MTRYFLLGAASGGALFLLALATNAFAAASAPVPAPAPLFPTALTQGDLPSLREVCTLAARNEKLTLEQMGAVTKYCGELLVRIGNALSAPKEAPASAPAPTSPPATGAPANAN